MLNIKTDAKLKKQAQAFAKKVGLPLSAIVNNALRQAVYERRVEFVEPLIPNAKTRKILDEAIKDITTGNMKDFSPVFDNADDAIAWLKSA